jgi:prepilin peptidase dependent protein B
MLKKFLAASGFTFTELMIALSINGFIFVALVAIFISGLTHYNTLFQTNQLYTELHAAMDIMVADIRRAGYWANASSIIGSHSNTNPFMASGTDISVGASNTCILMTYDHTQSGASSLPAISSSYDDLRYGYRLTNNAIQSRPRGATFACNAASNNWTNITDTNIIRVNTLTFALSTQVITVGSHTITVRYVTITITGALLSNSAVTETLVENVRIANDKYT